MVVRIVRNQGASHLRKTELSMTAAGISPPKKLTRPGVAIPGAGEVSDLDERLDSSLRANQPERKQVYAPFRDRFLGSLTVEFELWLASILAGQSQRSQSAVLGGALLVMQLVRRAQFRRRRSKQNGHKFGLRSRAFPDAPSLTPLL